MQNLEYVLEQMSLLPFFLFYENKIFVKVKNIFRIPIEICMGICYINCIKYPKKC